MLNHIVIMGRLTRDPEIRYTQSQLPVASFSVAVDRDYSGRDGGERQTDFINCTAWRSTAEFMQKYFHKGSMIVVSGRLQINQYQDREGKNRTAADVVADSVYFGESKRDSGNTGAYNQNSYSQNPYPQNSSSQPTYSYDNAPRSAPAASSMGGFSEMDDGDGELPF